MADHYATAAEIANRLAKPGLGTEGHVQYDDDQIEQALDDADAVINECLRYYNYDLAAATLVTDTKITPILKKIEIDLVFMFFQQARNANNRGVTDNVTGFWIQTPELTNAHRLTLKGIARRLKGSQPAYNYNATDGLR